MLREELAASINSRKSRGAEVARDFARWHHANGRPEGVGFLLKLIVTVSVEEQPSEVAG
jgi:hypothetical protein